LPPNDEDRARAIACLLRDAREGIADLRETRWALWVLFPHAATGDKFLGQLMGKASGFRALRSQAHPQKAQ